MKLSPTVVAPAAGLLARFLCGSWRFRDEASGRALRGPQPLRPALYALWHEQLLPLAYLHRGQGAVALVSRHRDGEILARVLTGLGYDVARGSSTRGGAAAYRALVRAGREGRPLALTPDGPRGPRRRADPGAVRAAVAAGVPIVPAAAAAERGWRLRSWDRFLVPAPGTRVWVAHGEALDPRATDALGHLEEALQALSERCLIAAGRAAPGSAQDHGI
ncbi:MAG: DUF374 domain-containing protein [Candidatus Palauibacterales bacterium]|nr:DUF374 domain-containing protein [Candidatus Palauibacterales bacterium]MDP2529406.1 DUF374 domain-containing protein [Candidatus Palauibacterales bacterium]MDP2583187.1 DUF374 domain-containing protein [Candidatus Palauibacterales bacterium]